MPPEPMVSSGLREVRNPRYGLACIWSLRVAALAVLLYRPVRGHFLGQNGGPRKATLPLARVSRASQAGKPLRILLYFTVAVVASCVATAFSLAVFVGQKNGGSRGFVLFLYFGLTTGCAASFLFALILTLLVRKFDPSRLWLWVLLGGSLAPCLIFALALIGRWFFVAGPFTLIFWAPETLFQVWWLTPPTGIFTAWVCYTMHPRVFSRISPDSPLRVSSTRRWLKLHSVQMFLPHH